MDAIEKLFSKWVIAQCEEKEKRNSFIEDGIIDRDRYSISQEKVLFLAKEGNIGDGVCNPNEHWFWLKNVAYQKEKDTLFSNRVSMLANALIKKDFVNVNKDHDILHEIAFMNLNKRGGGRNCDWNNLQEYTERYITYMQKEIELIAPDIIVCCGCGVEYLLKKYIRISSSIKVVGISHPSYFALSDIDYLQQLEVAITGNTYKKNERKKQFVKENTIVSKYAIVDTSETYRKGWVLDMISRKRFSAFGDASEMLRRFHKGDGIVYYVKGIGAVACGIVKNGSICQGDNPMDKYIEIENIVPSIAPGSMDKLIGISAKDIVALHKRVTGAGNGFWWNSTIKSPYLCKEEFLGLRKALWALQEETNESEACV